MVANKNFSLERSNEIMSNLGLNDRGKINEKSKKKKTTIFRYLVF